MAGRSESRQKTKLIQVRCTPEEKELLQAHASAFGISVGALCRDTIFGVKPKSKTDKHAIQELAKTRADLGRVGGLFKGWLAGSFEAQGVPGPKTKNEVVRMLREIEATQEKIAVLLESVESKT